MNHKKRMPLCIRDILSCSLLFNHLFAVVLATVFAHVVRFYELTAVLACYETRCVKLLVGTALVFDLFRGSSLWYCHVLHLLKQDPIHEVTGSILSYHHHLEIVEALQGVGQLSLPSVPQ